MKTITWSMFLLFLSQVALSQTIEISEVKPAGGYGNEWFEVHNTSNQPFDLNGVIISTVEMNVNNVPSYSCHTINNNGPLIIAPNQYLVFAGAVAILTNDGIHSVDYTYSNFFISDEHTGGPLFLYKTNGEFLSGIQMPANLDLQTLTFNRCGPFGAGRTRWTLASPSPNAQSSCVGIFSYGVPDINSLTFINPLTCLVSNTQTYFQSVEWYPVSDKTFGDAPFELTATSTAGLPISYELISGSVELADNIVTIVGSGDVTIKAFQPGDGNYPPAESTQTFHINKKSQEITFIAVDDVDLSNPNFSIDANSDSGLPLQFFVSGPIFRTTGMSFSAIGSGAASIVASQPGNENYLAAESVVRSFTVTDQNGGGTLGSAWFADLDGDGFGDGRSSLASCFALPGYVQNNQDCDDASAGIKPGAAEINDGKDNNCDGRIDEGFSTPSILPLTITAVCADFPLVTRRWKINNPNAGVIRVDWEITASIEKSWLDLPPGESFLTTIVVVKNPNTLKIYWHDDKGVKQSVQQTSITTKCVKGSSAGRLGEETAAGENGSIHGVALNAYPNPTSNRITVEIVSEIETQTDVQIVSPSGVIHQQSKVQLDRGTNFITHDITSLNAGVYLIKTGSATLRFIKE